MDTTSACTANSSADPGQSEVLQLVSFRVGDEEFGLEILKVQEIIRFQSLTRVPNLPNYVEGVLNLRGKVIPVISLRQRLGLEKHQSDNGTKIVVANVKNNVIGFIVDSVSEVLRIDSDIIEPAPQLRQKGGAENQYVLGIGKLQNRLLLLLDLDRMLSLDDDAQLADLRSAAAPESVAGSDAS
jgi:purine-binding chemotaxis protein CheW